MSAGTYAENMLLQYALLGATASRATAWTVGISLGVPAQGTLSEVGAGSGYARKAVGFASSVANTFTNTAAVTFGAYSSAANATGLFVVDQNGSLLVYGTLSPVTTIRAGSVGVIASGALKVSLA
jgi:hypothetical protein